MSEGTLEIREAEGHDAPALLDLLVRSAQETDFILFDQDMDSIDEDRFAQQLESSREAADSLCLLAFFNDQICGALNIRGYQQSRMDHIADLFIVVDQAFRGNRIGSYLLEEGLDWVNAVDVLRRIELTVQVRNEVAVHLYQKFGFEIEGVKKWGVQSADGQLLDLYSMALLIGSEV